MGRSGRRKRDAPPLTADEEERRNRQRHAARRAKAERLGRTPRTEEQVRQIAEQQRRQAEAKKQKLVDKGRRMERAQWQVFNDSNLREAIEQKEAAEIKARDTAKTCTQLERGFEEMSSAAWNAVRRAGAMAAAVQAAEPLLRTARDSSAAYRSDSSNALDYCRTMTTTLKQLKPLVRACDTRPIAKEIRKVRVLQRDDIAER